MRSVYVILLAAATVPGSAQTDWPAYGHDAGGTKFSPLRQINRSNVASLHRAWTYHTAEPERPFEATPLVAGGRMYLSTPGGRIVALSPETGMQIWSYDPQVQRPKANRGVSWWPGARGMPPRIMAATADGRLIALDAASGKPVLSFGDNGTVDLRTGISDRFPNASYGFTSPPAIYRDLAIVGPTTPEGPAKGPSGDPRAFDVRTGKLVWRFHTVPQPGEPGSDTWGVDGWKDRSGPSVWGPITVDASRGLVFLAVGNPADSFYGADRKGMNLYANCVVALDAATGKLRWYHQLVHHDIFDYDLPAGPALIEAVRNGKKIPAVAQITKMGLLFVLDRLTGEPIFGEEERPVAKSDVPGEASWPTQPFPLKPPPLARLSMTRSEVTRRTPEAQRYCAEQFDQFRGAALYTPFGLQKTLVFPGSMGGGNWGGVSFDPTLDLVFVNTTSLGGMGQMAPSPAGSPMPYRNELGYARFTDQDHYPCQQPPWGELSAVNTATGEVAWKVPLGNFDELEPQGLKNTGTPNVGGTLATGGGLVFVGATSDARFRAFDSRTGAEVWSARLDATGNATPISYLGRDGKQYVVIAAGGPSNLRNVGNMSANHADTLIAFALGGRDESSPPSTAPSVPADTVGGAAPQIAESSDLPEAPGKALVVRVCSDCHGVGTFAASRMSRQEWKDVVDDMVSRGAAADAQEIRAIVDYLAAHLGGAAGSRRKRGQ
ncbi:MAG TPA: PQQ-binding-like beta-propeller repeat protein [Bryobacteraceae bacterium]|nr:PQQ-binding-like beta-propeller repeat protein [Bryobacteraceae bacterium]